jgi:phosphate transport system substrate-binding protein
MKRNLMVAAFALVALTAIGCTEQERDADGAVIGRQLIRIDGSSTVFPITEAVAEEFQKESRARVTVGISGTGGGFKKFCNGETDISNASRPIKPSEVELCGANQVGYIELPIAYDGLAVVVHPENHWAETITIEELERIWEPEAQARIMRWNQVRPSWPDQPLRLYAPGIDSGTYDYFTEVVVGKAQASRGDFTSSEDDNVLVQGVATDVNALGFFGYAYYEENRARLKLVGVDSGRGAGPVAPSPDTVRDGSYEPLSRPVFIYVRIDSLDRPEVAAFVDFYVDRSEELVREVGYIPLSATIRQAVRQRYESRRTGSMFPDGQGHLTLEQALMEPVAATPPAQ